MKIAFLSFVVRASNFAARSISLTRDESGNSFIIIRHNIRTYQSAGVVEVLKGRQNAETTLKKLEQCQSSTDRHEGWRYFIEKTDLKPGMDPAQATRRRQAELETRESKAQQETHVPFGREGTLR